MVGQRPLKPSIGVRIPVPELIKQEVLSESVVPLVLLIQEKG